MRATLAAKWRAQVWGQPVAHSLSPALHNAAYEALEIDATYDRREVGVADLPAALEALDKDIRGLSLTMPLKEAILPLVSDHRGLVQELGAANTVIRHEGAFFLWNSDPAGITGALGANGVGELDRGVILGAGATARSAIRALHDMGAAELVIISRDEARAKTTLDYARSVGVKARWGSLASLPETGQADIVVSTLPHGVDLSDAVPAGLVRGAALLDVTYHPWPSPLARAWSASERPIVSGAQMLLHQAVIQIRLFTSGDAERELPGEADVVRAMQRALPEG